MNKKTFMLGVTALILGGSLVLPSAVDAYRGDPSVAGPDCTGEQHEEMEQAFETNNYEAWAGLMNGKGRVTQVVNADNFTQFAEAHRLAEAGQTEEAAQIRAELGLGLGDGSRNGSGDGQGQGNGQGYKGGQ